MIRLLYTLCLLIFIANPATAAGDKVLDIKTVKSKTGIEGWLVEDHSVPVIALQFTFKGAGAALDPADKQGLSRLASNTMDEGAGDLDSQSFQKELRDLSISLGFDSDRDHFSGHVKTLTRNKQRAFTLLRMALTQPRFDEEPVNRMRAENESRLRESMTDPDWIAARLQNDIAFAGHPYALNSGGTLSTLKNITADDLRAFTKARLGKNILRVSAAGDITAAELSLLIDEIFGALPDVTLPQVPAITLQGQGQTFLFPKDIPQTIIQIMQPGIDRHDPDYQTAQIMNYILGGGGFGSRLMEEIREKRGLTYGIYSGVYQSQKFNGISVGTSTKNENVGQLLDLTTAAWQNMAAAPPTEKELKDAQNYLIGSLPLSLSSTDDIAGLLQNLQLDDLPPDYLERRQREITSATPQDIQRVAKRLLDPARFVTILVGTPQNIDNAVIRNTLPNVE